MYIFLTTTLYWLERYVEDKNPRLREGDIKTANLESKWDDNLKHAKLQ